MNERLKKIITSPYLITCVVFVAVSVQVLHMRSVDTDEFLVRKHQAEHYHMLDQEIEAEAAIIYDIKNDTILAGKNPVGVRSIASITKLPAALVMVPYIGEDDTTVIEESDFELYPNTPLELGDVWRTSDLLEYSLLTSSNRGINAVGRTVEEKTGRALVDMMNEFAERNGLVQTHFLNPTGLDAHGTLAGSESSAIELAKIAAIIVTEHEDLAALTTHQEREFYSVDDVRYEAVNTNELIGALDEEVLLSKTGLTSLAGGTLIMVVQDGTRQIALVVLGSTDVGRFSDMQTLLEVYQVVVRAERGWCDQMRKGTCT